MFDGREYWTAYEAALQVPGGVSPSTIWRWCLKGVVDANGNRVRLKHLRVGRKLFIDPQDLEAFADALIKEYVDAKNTNKNNHIAQRPRLRPHHEAHARVMGWEV